MEKMEKLYKAKTVEELKKIYRKMALVYHPDKGGSDKEMAELNNLYEKLFDQLKEGNTKETNRQFVDIIDKLMKFDGLEIDIVGTWVWVYGNTHACKEELKEMGFRWASKKKKWYLGEFTKKKRSSMTYKQIVDKYGVEKHETKKVKKLTVSA